MEAIRKIQTDASARAAWLGSAALSPSWSEDTPSAVGYGRKIMNKTSTANASKS